AKIIMPVPKDAPAAEPVETVKMVEERKEYSNVFLAAANGAQTGVSIAIAVAAMLIAFISLIALVNGLLGWGGGLVGLDGLSIQTILGWIFAPIMWAIGVPWDDAQIGGAIFGEKVVLNEFIAYLSLIEVQEELSPKSITILTFAVCGFANFSSIGILLGGLGTIIPERKAEIARMGLKAVFAASLANLMSAALAGILVGL
ncbi:MAG: nucleoside transporter C-terminal domain-containing protein, partial [Pseudomonadota bacterium]